MISLETTYILITSVTLIIISLVVYVIINRFTKLISSVIIDLQNKYVELLSLVNENRYTVKTTNNRLVDISTEIDSITTRLLKVEARIFGKKVEKSKEEIVIKKEEKKKLNETEITILKLLMEGPKTSKEIREALDLSREHVARELKHLYEIGYLERRTETKPYKYKIKEELLSELEKLVS